MSKDDIAEARLIAMLDNPHQAAAIAALPDAVVEALAAGSGDGTDAEPGTDAADTPAAATDGGPRTDAGAAGATPDGDAPDDDETSPYAAGTLKAA